MEYKLENFKGIIPALVTPLTTDYKINKKSLSILINYLIENNVNGIFVGGSQGEFYGLELPEKIKLFELTVEFVNGRVPVYVGTGAITTIEAINLIKISQKISGVSVAVILTPFFITPNNNELFEHYKKITENSNLPIILYSNSAKTGVKLSSDLVSKLSGLKRIIGLKDSEEDLGLTEEYIKNTNNNFKIFTGRDNLIYDGLLLGTVGSISATANVIPSLVVKIFQNVKNNNLEEALGYQKRVSRLRSQFNLGTFPVVVKEALNLLGIDVGYAFPPIQNLSDSKRKKLKKVLKEIM